jgi:hypothetical protein
MVGQILGQSLVRGNQTASDIGVAGWSTSGMEGLIGPPGVRRTSKVDTPARAAVRARVADIVLLPTPPFPATMSTRDAAKNRAGSIFPSEARDAQTT